MCVDVDMENRSRRFQNVDYGQHIVVVFMYVPSAL